MIHSFQELQITASTRYCNHSHIPINFATNQWTSVHSVSPKKEISLVPLEDPMQVPRIWFDLHYRHPALRRARSGLGDDLGRCGQSVTALQRHRWTYRSGGRCTCKCSATDAQCCTTCSARRHHAGKATCAVKLTHNGQVSPWSVSSVLMHARIDQSN